MGVAFPTTWAGTLTAMGELMLGRGFILGPFDGGVVLLAETSASCFLSVRGIGGVPFEMEVGVVFWDSSGGVVLGRVEMSAVALVAEVGGGGGALLVLGALKVVVEVNLSSFMGVVTSVGVPCLEPALCIILPASDDVDSATSRGVPLLEDSLAFSSPTPSEVGVASDDVSTGSTYNGPSHHLPHHLPHLLPITSSHHLPQITSTPSLHHITSPISSYLHTHHLLHHLPQTLSKALAKPSIARLSQELGL